MVGVVTNLAFDRIVSLQSSLGNMLEDERLHLILNANLYNSFCFSTISVELLLIGFAEYAQSLDHGLILQKPRPFCLSRLLLYQCYINSYMLSMFSLVIEGIYEPLLNL